MSSDAKRFVFWQEPGYGAAFIAFCESAVMKDGPTGGALTVRFRWDHRYFVAVWLKPHGAVILTHISHP